MGKVKTPLHYPFVADYELSEGVSRMAQKPIDLDVAEAKQWLKGQRVAQEIIKR